MYAVIQISVSTCIKFIITIDFKMDQLVCKATNVAFKHLQQSTMIFRHDR